KYLFTASSDKTIKQWDITSGELVRKIELGEFAGPDILKVSPNGKYLLVSSKDTFKFLILDISTGKVINKQDGLLHKITPALSPDGRYITTSTDSTVRIWDAF